MTCDVSWLCYSIFVIFTPYVQKKMVHLMNPMHKIMTFDEYKSIFNPVILRSECRQEDEPDAQEGMTRCHKMYHEEMEREEG